MTLKADIKKRVNTLNVWKRHGERAPHKPLLILLALSRIVAARERLTPFTEIDAPLTNLLQHYGQPRNTHHTEFPFWYLRNDELWELHPDKGDLTDIKGQQPSKKELREMKVRGGFPEDVYNLFFKDRDFMDEIVRTLLEGHFPASYHEDILNELGLYYSLLVRKRTRDSSFRKIVVQAYEHRCAICGYDLKVGKDDLALDAAHIKWHAYGGPDEIANGLALCAIHHKALDRGAVGITPGHRILISADLYGGGWANEWFLRFNGNPIREPHSPSLRPGEDFISWHLREVFRNPAREHAM